MAKARMKKTRPTALVTGASGGIGEELAYAFAEGGYDLVLVARSADKLAGVAGRAEALGAACTVVAQDLLAPDAGARIEAATKGIEIDALVNNAGYGLTGGFLDGDRDDLLAMIDLDVRALTDLTHRFGKGMRARGRGGVLNVASTAAFQPGPWMGVYYAAKAYVLSFSEGLNHELKGTGVHVTALCPGPVLTGFQDRADFDDSMRLLKAMKPMSAEAVARAGFKGFKARKAVVIPGATNFLMAKSAAVTPRPVLLSVVDLMQKKKGSPSDRHP